MGKARFFFDSRGLITATISTEFGRRVIRQDPAESRRELVRSVLEALHAFEQSHEEDVFRVVSQLWSGETCVTARD